MAQVHNMNQIFTNTQLPRPLVNFLLPKPLIPISGRWSRAPDCPKYVEQIIIAIKHSLASSWFFLCVYKQWYLWLSVFWSNLWIHEWTGGGP